MPEALWLLQTLALIEFTLFALYMALGAEDAIAGLITKLMWICAFIFLVTMWPTLTKIVLDSFMQVGLQAGSGGAQLFTVMEFTNPCSVARFGLEVTANIFRYLNSISGMFYGVRNPHIVFISGVSAFAIVIAYFLIAIQIFICLLEFYLVSTLALILVPWGIFRHTAFLAERAFGLIIAFGIKLMVLGCIVAAMQPVLVTLQIPEAPELNDIFSPAPGLHCPRHAGLACAEYGSRDDVRGTEPHREHRSPYGPGTAATVGLTGVASIGAVRAATAAGRGSAHRWCYHPGL